MGQASGCAALTPCRSTAAPHRTEACLWLRGCDVDRPMFCTCGITHCDVAICSASMLTGQNAFTAHTVVSYVDRLNVTC